MFRSDLTLRKTACKSYLKQVYNLSPKVGAFGKRFENKGGANIFFIHSKGLPENGSGSPLFESLKEDYLRS